MPRLIRRVACSRRAALVAAGLLAGAGSQATPAISSPTVVTAANPKAGVYTGDPGFPVSFRVKAGQVRHFHIKVSCGTYDIRTIHIRRGKFHGRAGTPSTHFVVNGTFTGPTTADLAWFVGYGDPHPGCLAHDSWTAHWRHS